MTIRPLQDPILAMLAQQLKLEAPANLASWLTRAERELGAPRLEELQDWRKRLYSEARQASPTTSLASEAAFYQFVASNQAISAVMVEGRLGYYDAILPAVASRVGQVPHARILDLGSYSGLPSIYLAKQFPDAQVVGIERCKDAVQRAQELQARTGLKNVEFERGLYDVCPAEVVTWCCHSKPCRPFCCLGFLGGESRICEVVSLRQRLLPYLLASSWLPTPYWPAYAWRNDLVA